MLHRKEENTGSASFCIFYPVFFPPSLKANASPGSSSNTDYLFLPKLMIFCPAASSLMIQTSKFTCNIEIKSERLCSAKHKKRRATVNKYSELGSVMSGHLLKYLVRLSSHSGSCQYNIRWEEKRWFLWSLRNLNLSIMSPVNLHSKRNERVFAGMALVGNISVI